MAFDCMQYRGEESPVNCNIIDPNSQPWDANWGDPEHFNNPAFQSFIQDNYGRWQFPEGYIDQTAEDICDQQDFTLSEHQKLLGQWINPKNPEMKGCLIWHGLGSGKTCTATVIKIAWEIWNTHRDPNNAKRKTVIVTPAALTEQWREALFKQSDCGSQCLNRDGSAYIPDMQVSEQAKDILAGRKISELDTQEKEMLQNLYKGDSGLIINNMKKYTDIVSHQTFLNQLLTKDQRGMLRKNDRLISRSEKSIKRKKKKKNELVNLTAPNKLIIIDEIHKLISIRGSEYRRLLWAIQHYIHESSTIVLLSATPLFDSPVELGLTLNLLKPTIPFPSDSEVFQNWFQRKDKNGAISNKKLFQLMAAGYVSYFSGGNPNAYPDKIITFVNHRLSEIQEDTYGDVLVSKLEEQPESNTDRTSDFEKVLGNFEINARLGKDDMTAGWITPILQIANIALPDPNCSYRSPYTTNMTNDKIKQKNARKKLEKILIQARDDNFPIQPELDCFKTNPIFGNENMQFDYVHPEGNLARVVQYLNQLSTKYAWILNSLLTSEGTAFIYTSWVELGAKVWETIFKAIGWNKWTRQQPGEFFIWSGEVSSDSDLTRDAKDAFNRGEIRVLIGTRSVTEGVDLKNTRTVHISDPWWNESRIEQIIARAIRRCSHITLPPEQRNVMVYRHTSVLSSYPQSTDDIKRKLEDNPKAKKGISKLLDINSVEIQQKNTAVNKLERTNTFRSALKEIAFDCNLMENGNLIKLFLESIPIYKYTIIKGETRRYEHWIQDGYQTTWVDPSDYSHWIIEEEKDTEISIRKMKKVFYGPKGDWGGYTIFREENIEEFKSNLSENDNLEQIMQSEFMNLQPEVKLQYKNRDNSKRSLILFKWEPTSTFKSIDRNLITREEINCYTGELNLEDIDLEPEIRYQVIKQYNNFNLYREFREDFANKSYDELLQCITHSYNRSDDRDYRRKIDSLKNRTDVENRRKSLIKQLAKYDKKLAGQLESDPNITEQEIEAEIERKKNKSRSI